MVKGITAADHARVSAAIAEAESRTDGEILAVTTELSDRYHDVALHWSVILLFGTIALFAALPELLASAFGLLFGGWRSEPSLGELLTLLLIIAALVFTATLLALRYMPLRLALTPAATRTRRVRRRAIEIFKAAAERRTVGRTGILIYLSLGEHRAEIIGDEAIARVAPPESWADEMEALLAEAREGRYVDGIVAAAARVGSVLAEHFPKSRDNPNEIPDKLVEL